MLVAQVEAFLQIAVIRYKHSGFSLDRLGDERAHFLAVLVESFLESLRIVVRDADEARGQRTVLSVRRRVVAHCDDGDGSSVEVSATADDLDLVVRNALLYGSPAAGELEGCLYAFGSGVHREDLVIAEIVVHEFLVLAQAVVIERP